MTPILIIAVVVVIGLGLVYWYFNKKSTENKQTNSSFESFLKNNFTAGSTENFTADNLNYIQKFYGNIMEIIPSDLKNRIICSDLTRENIQQIMSCAMPQLSLDILADEEKFAILMTSMMSIFAMLNNKELEPIDILEYTPATKTIKVKNEMLKSTLNPTISFEINGKNINYVISQTVQPRGVYSLDFTKVDLPVPSGGAQGLEVKYNGKTKQLLFNHQSIPAHGVFGVGPDFINHFDQSFADIQLDLDNLSIKYFINSIKNSQISPSPARNCYCASMAPAPAPALAPVSAPVPGPVPALPPVYALAPTPDGL